MDTSGCKPQSLSYLNFIFSKTVLWQLRHFRVAIISGMEQMLVEKFRLD